MSIVIETINPKKVRAKRQPKTSNKIEEKPILLEVEDVPIFESKKVIVPKVEVITEDMAIDMIPKTYDKSFFNHMPATARRIQIEASGPGIWVTSGLTDGYFYVQYSHILALSRHQYVWDIRQVPQRIFGEKYSVFSKEWKRLGLITKEQFDEVLALNILPMNRIHYVTTELATNFRSYSLHHDGPPTAEELKAHLLEYHQYLRARGIKVDDTEGVQENISIQEPEKQEAEVV